MSGVATTAARRRGACPSLSAPMATGDGLLVRLPLASLSPPALRAVAAAAARFGNGVVEVSGRGNLQLRGLSAASVEGLRRALETARVVPAEPRLLVAPAFDGVDPGPLATTLAARLAGLDDRLGPKVGALIDGGGRWPLDAVAADVRLVARAGGWHVAVGGRASDARRAGFAPAADAAAAAAAHLLAAVAALGPDARGRDLPPDALAAAGLRPAPPPAVRPPAPLGVVAIPGGAVAALALPFGATDAATLGALADAAGDATIAFAPRTLLLRTGTPAAAAALVALGRALGLVADDADPRRTVAACAGRPACAAAELDARGVAARIAPFVPPGAIVHVSGCGKRCADPGNAAAEIVGTPAGITLRGDPGVLASFAPALP